MAVDEKRLVQSDSSGMPSYSVKACSHVLVLHSMGDYNDGSTSMMLWSPQHQDTRAHTVCIKLGDALPMVKGTEQEQRGCTGAACLCVGWKPSACSAAHGSCSSAAYRGAAASLWPAVHAPSSPAHAWHPCWPGALAEGQICSGWNGLCLSLPSSRGKTSRHAWKQPLLLGASAGPSQQPELPGHMQTVWCMLVCESGMLSQHLIL